MNDRLATAIQRAAQRLSNIDSRTFGGRLRRSAEGGLAADMLEAGVFLAREQESQHFARVVEPEGLTSLRAIPTVLAIMLASIGYGEDVRAPLHPLTASPMHMLPIGDRENVVGEGYTWVA